MATYPISWNRGVDTWLKFDPACDHLDFRWMGAEYFTISEIDGSVVVGIPRNRQSYVLRGVGLADLGIHNIVACNMAAIDVWKTVLDVDDRRRPTAPRLTMTGDGCGAAQGPSSPFVDVSGTARRDLIRMVEDMQIPAITLGYLRSSGHDRIGWSGRGAVAGDTAPRRDRVGSIVEDLQLRDIDVTVCFGGVLGKEPALTFSCTEALIDAYQAVIDRYNIDRLDFELCDHALHDHRANALRSAALVALQDANPELSLSFTLPVLETGLTPDGMRMLDQAQRTGLEIHMVNVLPAAMGEARDSDETGDFAVSAAEATISQLWTNCVFVPVTALV